MKLLAIDTSGTTLSAALLALDPPPPPRRPDPAYCPTPDPADARIIASCGVNTGRNHSVALLPLLQSLLDACELSMREVDVIAATVGPGSFTGLRIGCATVLAWEQALHKPLVAIRSTEAAAAAASAEGLVCPLFDARRSEVYAALFEDGKRLWEDAALTPQELCRRLRELGRPVLLTGDGYPVWRSLLERELEGLLRPRPVHACFMAEAAARLALDRALAHDFTPPQRFMPVYLRLSEAEEKLLARTGSLPDAPTVMKHS